MRLFRWLDERGKERSTWVAIMGAGTVILSQFGLNIDEQVKSDLSTWIASICAFVLFIMREKVDAPAKEPASTTES